MYLHNQFFITLFIVLAMLFTTACNNNKEKIAILKIDGIWKDHIPENMESKFPPSSCSKVQSYLLIPDSVQKGSELNVKLYGCWDSGNRIFGNQTFYTFKTTKNNHKLTFTAYKKIALDHDPINDAQVDYFALKSEYNLTTDDLNEGTVEFVVKNPNHEELISYINVD